MLSTGDKIPKEIKLKNIEDKDVTLADFIDKYLILYFYPKDNTPGCTTEACEFRDYNKKIESIGGKIIGISKDKIKSHKKFIEDHTLNFTLLSDENHELQEAFGVWQKKKFMGKEYMGTERATFLINPNGIIVKIWAQVKPEGHAKDVYDSIMEIESKI